MRFRDIFSLKQIIMAVLVLTLFILIGLWDSATQVKVSFHEQSVVVKADKYQMDIPYDRVESVELVVLPEAGTGIKYDFDDNTMRSGYWENKAWGPHHVIVDLEAENCIVLRLDNGEIFVFSRKDTASTTELYHTLCAHLK